MVLCDSCRRVALSLCLNVVVGGVGGGDGGGESITGLSVLVGWRDN